MKPLNTNVIWTPEKIKKFWARFEKKPGKSLCHFSLQRGNPLVRYVSRRIGHYTTALDVGCGSGHLLDILATSEKLCYGCDVSAESMQFAISRLKGNPWFKGVKLIDKPGHLPYNDSFFDTVFMLETIEHIDEAHIRDQLLEIQRIVKPGGHCIITTPCNESLHTSYVTCPLCQARFHVMQHVQSFTASRLFTYLKGAGFSNIRCRSVVLLPDWKIWVRAKKQRTTRWQYCPECENDFINKQFSPISRWIQTIGELRHLVGIAQKQV